MKITCDACGSKYSIADDKVRGKRVKVRCKSCQASILVDGTSTGDGSLSEDEGVLEDASIAPAIPSSPDKPKLPSGTWSVNLSDDDSRDMTTAQIVAAWQKGEVTSDAYVWKDGMDDWAPIQDVPELRQKLGPARPAAPAKPATVARPAARASIADDGVTTSAKVAKPAGKGRAGSMDDLFGGVDFAGRDEDHAAAAPTATEEKPRGARNESSVLFSLDALKAGVEAETATAAPAKPSDDPFNLGSGGGGFGGGFGGFGNAADLLTAPVKEPPRPVVQASPTVAAAPKGGAQKSKGLIIGVVVGVLALGGAAFAMLGGGDDKAEEQTAAASEDAAKDDAAAEAEKKAMAEQLAKAEQEKKAMAEQLAKAEEEKKQAEASAAEAKKEEEKPADTAKPAEAKPAETKTVTASAAKTESKPAAAAPAAGIDMAAVKSALGAASARAGSCSKPGGPTGTGKAQVTFAPSGRVTNAVVTGGAFGGTAVGGCVASTFRSARIPAFSGAPVTVAKSFTVR